MTNQANLAIIVACSNRLEEMAKTKSVGTKVDPAFNFEIERLKEAFGFASFGELLEAAVQVLQEIDEEVCQIDRHPRDWSKDDLLRHLSKSVRQGQDTRTVELFQRRLRERFGQDGVERIQELLASDHARQVTHR